MKKNKSNKKNKDFRVNGMVWFIVVVVITGALALLTNVGGLRGVRNLDLPVVNSIVAPPASQAAGSPNTALAIQEGISHAVSMVKPSVVVISGLLPSGQANAQAGLTYIQPYTDSTGSSIGSGVIVDPRGYILTTFQTVGKAKEVEVTVFSAERQKYLADVMATDPQTDLVLLKIRSFDSFSSAIIGNSESLEVGDIVLAVGSPFGFSKTVTMGIVSTNRRQLNISGIRYPDMIQTDAAINDGDDGGPLINVKGEVIGINMAYFVPGNHFTGIGFALPINNAKPLLNTIQ